MTTDFSRRAARSSMDTVKRLGDSIQRAVPRSRISSVFGRILFALAVGYVCALTLLGFNQIRHLDWLQYLRAAGFGLLIYPIALLTQGLAWSLLIGGLTRVRPGISWFDVRTYASSQLMKRLPGGVWYVAGRASQYSDRGISAKISIAASGIELALVGLTAGALFVSLTYLHLSVPLTMAISIGLSVLAGCLAIVILSRAPSLGRVSMERFAMGGRLAPWQWLALTLLLLGALYASSVLVGAAILNQLANAGTTSTLPFEQALRIWSLIAGIGAIVAVVPFGIGLRDLTVASVLSLALTPGEAIVTAAFIRLILMVGDVIWGIPLWAVSRWLAGIELRRSWPPVPTTSPHGPTDA
jgi:hypothetical protein